MYSLGNRKVIPVENNSFYRMNGISAINSLNAKMVGVNEIKDYCNQKINIHNKTDPGTFWFDPELTYLLYFSFRKRHS